MAGLERIQSAVHFPEWLRQELSNHIRLEWTRSVVASGLSTAFFLLVRLYPKQIESQGAPMSIEQQEIMRFARAWIPFGGPRPEDIFVIFGMTPARYDTALLEVVDAEPVKNMTRLEASYFASVRARAVPPERKLTA